MERIGQIAQTIDLTRFATVSATEPSALVSSKYSMASTSSILKVFEDQGWMPVGYREKRARSDERKGKQTHTIVLSNETLNGALAVGSTLPRIMLKNSHDGGSSLQLLSGLFEKICANGLVVGSSASDIRIRHLSLSEDRVLNGISETIKNLGLALEMSERMKAVRLDTQQQLTMAQDVIDMAWNGSEYAIAPSHLLYNHRREQRESTLWNTFNTIQEHVIRGGVRQVRADGSRIRSREVKAIDRSIDLNRGMWDIAESKLAVWK